MAIKDRYDIAWGWIVWQMVCPPIGACLIFFLKPNQVQSIPLGLAFASGILIWVSLLGLHVESLEAFTTGIEKQYKTHFEDKYSWLPRFALLCSMIFGVLCGIFVDWLSHKIGGGHGHSHDHETVGVTLKKKLSSNPTVRDGNQLKDDTPQQSRDSTPRPTEEPLENDHLNIELGKPKITSDKSQEDSDGYQKDDDDSGNDTLPPVTRKETKREAWRKQTGLTENESQELETAGFKNFVAITLHNIPEGLSLFIATVVDPKLGGAVAIAYAMHEIPFGISVATPVYFATGSKVKTIIWAFICGVSDCVGAAIANIIVETNGNLHNNTSGFIFGSVCGLMIYVSFNELLPTAFKLDKEMKYVTPLVFIGFLVMDVVFVIFDATGGHSHAEEDDGHAHRRRSLLNLLL